MNSRRNFISKGSLAAVALLAAKPVAAVSSIDRLFFPSGNGDTLNLFYANNSFRFPGNELDSSVFNEFSQRIHSLGKRGSEGVWLDAAYSVSDGTSLNGDQNQLHQIIHDVNRSAAIDTVEKYSNTLSFQTIKLSNAKVGVITQNAASDHNLLLPGIYTVTEEIHTLASRLKTENNCSFIIVTSSDNKQLDYMELAENSSDIDIVIGIMESSRSKVNIVRNKLKCEVMVINQGGEIKNMLRNIEIAFDDQGSKKSIAFKNFFV